MKYYSGTCCQIPRISATYLIHIADRPTLGNGELYWDVTSLEVAPTPGSIICGPLVVEASVESGVVALPAIVAGHPSDLYES